MESKKRTSILVYPSDKNGCGFYRTFIPLRYLASKYDKEINLTEYYAYNFDMNYIRCADWMRFQRQITSSQTKVIKQFKGQIEKYKFKTKIMYELDDLVHGIEKSNILAYQFYTPSRKNNLIEIFKLSDTVTFSTKYLKDFYSTNFGINNSVVVPNYLPRYMWWACGKRDKYNKGKKLRILWAGSASHIGKGGDMEFLLPLIQKTLNEFEWVFFGVVPPTLKGKVEFHSWCEMHEYPQKIDSIDADIAISPIKDVEFNYAKSDLKILEYSALGLPCIASSIGTKTMTDESGQITSKRGQGPYDLIDGLCTVENKIDSWYQAIKIMETDLNKRNQYMEAGKTELNKRWLEDNIEVYKNLFIEKKVET